MPSSVDNKSNTVTEPDGVAHTASSKLFSLRSNALTSSSLNTSSSEAQQRLAPEAAAVDAAWLLAEHRLDLAHGCADAGLHVSARQRVHQEVGFWGFGWAEVGGTAFGRQKGTQVIASPGQ